MYAELLGQLNDTMDSEQPCPPGPPAGYFGSVDGNQDGVVNQQDLDNLNGSATGGGSSWYDIDFSGTTNAIDYALVSDYLGIECQH